MRSEQSQVSFLVGCTTGKQICDNFLSPFFLMKWNIICSQRPSAHSASSCRFPCSLCGPVMYSSQGEVRLLGGVKKRKKVRKKNKKSHTFCSLCSWGSFLSVKYTYCLEVEHLPKTWKQNPSGDDDDDDGERRKGKWSHCWLNEIASPVLCLLPGWL